MKIKHEFMDHYSLSRQGRDKRSVSFSFLPMNKTVSLNIIRDAVCHFNKRIYSIWFGINKC